MKKIFQLVVCLLVAAFLLTGCGGAQNVPAQSSESANKNTGSQGEENLKSIFAGASEIKSLSFDMVMTSEGKEMSRGKTWIKGKKSKMQFTTETGENAIMYVNGEENAAYHYLPDQNIATKIDFARAEAQSGNSPLDYSEELGKDNARYKELGEETVNGYSCKVLEVTEGEDAAKVWVSKDYGIPARVETKADGHVITMDYSNIRIGDIPDSEFKLPAGAQVVDMADMMKNMPQAPQQ